MLPKHGRCFDNFSNGKEASTTTKEKVYQPSHVVHQYTTSYYSNRRERLGAREGLREGEREREFRSTGRYDDIYSRRQVLVLVVVDVIECCVTEIVWFCALKNNEPSSPQT